MAAAHTSSSLAGYRVDLVNKHDAGGVFLGLLKHVADTGRADAHIHLHEVRSGNGEERHLRLPGHRLGKQGFSGSRRSHQNHSLGNSGSHSRIFLRILQEIYDLLQLLLLLAQACYVSERHLAVSAHPGSASAEIHHLGIASSGVPQIHKHEKRCQKSRRQKNRKHNRQSIILLGYFLYLVGNAIVPELLCKV